MSNRCDECQFEVDGDGGCQAPCNLCNENDAIQFCLNHKNEQAVVMMLCSTMHINMEQLKDVKNNFKEDKQILKTQLGDDV